MSEVYPYRAVPLCTEHEERIYDNPALVREFHNGLPDEIVRGLFGH
jgi:hypothetical protein